MKRSPRNHSDAAKAPGSGADPLEKRPLGRQKAKASGRARPPSDTDSFRSKDVLQLLGISRRQLQYWAQTDLVVPSTRTPGGHHRYNFEDLVALKTTKRLIDAGVSVQRIRKSIRTLRDLLPRVERPLAELTLVATGDVVLVFHQDTVFEAASGQEWVFEVARFQREVESWRRLARPARPARPAGKNRRATSDGGSETTGSG